MLLHSQFLLLNAAAAMLLLAPLPLVFNTIPGQPGSWAASLLFATEKFKFSARQKWPWLQAIIYLMNTASWHLPVAKWVLNAKGEKKRQRPLIDMGYQLRISAKQEVAEGSKIKEKNPSIKATTSSRGAVNNLLINERKSWRHAQFFGKEMCLLYL